MLICFEAFWKEICYEIGNGIEAMKKYVELSEICVNGGLTNSEPFNQIQSDVYGTPISAPWKNQMQRQEVHLW